MRNNKANMHKTIQLSVVDQPSYYDLSSASRTKYSQQSSGSFTQRFSNNTILTNQVAKNNKLNPLFSEAKKMPAGIAA